MAGLASSFFRLFASARRRRARVSTVAVGALSLNVLVGYAGQISLGHQAFIGIGSFTAGYVISQSHQSFYVALVAACLVDEVRWLVHVIPDSGDTVVCVRTMKVAPPTPRFG